MTREPGDLPDAVVLHPGRVHRVSEVPVSAGHPSRNDSHRLPDIPGGTAQACVGVAPAPGACAPARNTRQAHAVRICGSRIMRLAIYACPAPCAHADAGVRS